MQELSSPWSHGTPVYTNQGASLSLMFRVLLEFHYAGVSHWSRD